MLAPLLVVLLAVLELSLWLAAAAFPKGPSVSCGSGSVSRMIDGGENSTDESPISDLLCGYVKNGTESNQPDPTASTECTAILASP